MLTLPHFFPALKNSIWSNPFFTWVTIETHLVFCPLACHSKWTVFCKCCFTMTVFQVDAKLVLAANSQAVNLVQSKPKLAVQISKAPFVVSPAAVEIYRAVPPLLKHRPTSTGCFLITEHFKFTQTIRIDFLHSTDPVSGLVSFSTVVKNWNYWAINIPGFSEIIK